MVFHILLSFLFYNCLLYNVWKHYSKGDYYIGKKSIIIYVLLFISFGTYGGGEGDYIHLKQIVESFQDLSDVFFRQGMEIQYNYLAYYVGGNYTLWRLAIYSVQFIGLGWFLYKAKMNTYTFLICFISLSLVSSVYGRSVWGVIYFYMGIYLFVEKKNPLFLIAVFLCYFSHTQNIVLLAMLPLAFVDIKKWHLLIFFLFFGALTTLLRDNFTSLLDSGGIDGAEYVNNKMTTYAGDEGRGLLGKSIGESAITLLHYLPFIFYILTLFDLIFNKRVKYLSYYTPYRRVLNITIGIVLVSLIVLFSSLGSSVFFFRILGLAFFPVSILLPYMLKTNTIKKNTFNKYILVFIITTELNYIKDIYYAFSNGGY